MPVISTWVTVEAYSSPESSRSGDVIHGLDAQGDFRIYHAGTRRNADGQWETNGGRVLAIVSGGASRMEAVQQAHAATDQICFDGLQRRRDIGILHFD